MKVLLLNQFFHPDLSATAQIATDLGEDLVAAGWEVTALAGRGSYLGGRQLEARGAHAGISIVRSAATSLGKQTLLHRAVDYASFYVTATAAVAALPRHDVVVVLTTPPLIAVTALAARALKGSRVVYWVQDLYPEVAVAFGALGARSPLTVAMRGMSRVLMGRSDLVVTLGDAMRNRCIAAGSEPARTVVLPNWSDAAAVRPVPHERNDLRRSIAGSTDFIVMYSGNMGRAHDLRTLLDAARLLRDDPRIRFEFIGDGAKRVEVERVARELPNVRLGPYQPRERLSEALSAGDAHLVTLSPEVEGLIEPSKLYGIMAAGRPALFVGPRGSEVARTIEREGCGRVFDNGDSAGIAAAIRELVLAPELAAEMGRRARTALELRYDRRIATAGFARLLRGVCSGRDARPPTLGS